MRGMRSGWCHARHRNPRLCVHDRMPEGCVCARVHTCTRAHARDLARIAQEECPSRSLLPHTMISVDTYAYTHTRMRMRTRSYSTLRAWMRLALDALVADASAKRRSRSELLLESVS